MTKKLVENPKASNYNLRQRKTVYNPKAPDYNAESKKYNKSVLRDYGIQEMKRIKSEPSIYNLRKRKPVSYYCTRKKRRSTLAVKIKKEKKMHTPLTTVDTWHAVQNENTSSGSNIDVKEEFADRCDNIDECVKNDVSKNQIKLEIGNDNRNNKFKSKVNDGDARLIPHIDMSAALEKGDYCFFEIIVPERVEQDNIEENDGLNDASRRPEGFNVEVKEERRGGKTACNSIDSLIEKKEVLQIPNNSQDQQLNTKNSAISEPNCCNVEIKDEDERTTEKVKVTTDDPDMQNEEKISLPVKELKDKGDAEHFPDTPPTHTPDHGQIDMDIQIVEKVIDTVFIDDDDNPNLNESKVGKIEDESKSVQIDTDIEVVKKFVDTVIIDDVGPNLVESDEDVTVEAGKGGDKTKESKVNAALKKCRAWVEMTNEAVENTVDLEQTENDETESVGNNKEWSLSPSSSSSTTHPSSSGEGSSFFEEKENENTFPSSVCGSSSTDSMTESEREQRELEIDRACDEIAQRTGQIWRRPPKRESIFSEDIPPMPDSIAVYTPAAQRVVLHPNFDRPTHFKKKKDQQMWDYATRINYSRRIEDIEEGWYIPDNVCKKVEEDFIETANGVSRQIQKIEERPTDEEMRIYKTENLLLYWDTCVKFDLPEAEHKIGCMINTIFSHNISTFMFVKYPHIFLTIKRLIGQRRYPELRHKASLLYLKIKNMTRLAEDETLEEYIKANARRLLNLYKDMPFYEFITLTEERYNESEE